MGPNPIYRLCADCHGPFIAQTALQFICGNCKPHCKGCGTRFFPKDKSRLLCTECEDKKSKHICTNCGVLDYPESRTSNGYGHCADCISEADRFNMIDTHNESRVWCVSCETELNISNSMTARCMCNNCLSQRDTCQYCGKNEKYKEDYACNECQIKFMKTEKTYKLPQ